MTDEGAGGESAGSSWFGGFMASVREGINTTRRDLGEFSAQVQTDTVNVLADTAVKLQQQTRNPPRKRIANNNTENDTSAAFTVTDGNDEVLNDDEDADIEERDIIDDVADKITSGFASFLGTLSSAVASIDGGGLYDDSGCSTKNTAPNMEFSERPQRLVICDKGTYSRVESLLADLQDDPQTYSVEPDDSSDFQAWRQAYLDLNMCTEQISQLLSDHSGVRGLHTRLVPTVISYDTFWARYFYAVHKVKEAEKRRQDLIERAKTQLVDETDKWDDDDTWGGGCRDEEEDVLGNSNAMEIFSLAAATAASTAPPVVDDIDEDSRNKNKLTSMNTVSSCQADDDAVLDDRVAQWVESVEATTFVPSSPRGTDISSLRKGSEVGSEASYEILDQHSVSRPITPVIPEITIPTRTFMGTTLATSAVEDGWETWE